MIRGFYTGASSLISQQTNMNTIANNVANISTTAFKPQQTAFSALMYQSVPGGGGEGNTISAGSGVKVEKTAVDFAQGNLQSTGMSMDCAIIGDGFFAIQNGEDGDITYTRDGSFQLSMDGSNSYLVNAGGGYVLDASGDKIEVAEVTTKKDAEGKSITTGGFDPTKIGVYRFPNQYGLEMAGGNQYGATERSGEAEAIEKPEIQVGYLEASRVQIAQEMAKMIEASKGFSFGSRIVQTADDMEKVINQLR